MTFEDMTGLFLKAADGLGLVTHPEYWLNTRSLEREFACTCHTGKCEDVEQQSVCTIAFSWGSLDTALSLEGPKGVCEFFHEPEEDCNHLHTGAIPPLVLDLSYNHTLNGVKVSEETLLALTQMLKLRASEHSRRTIETRPGISLLLQDNRLRPDMLTLQQRVEIPLWHPLGMHGLHDDPREYIQQQHTHNKHDVDADDDDLHQETWLPQVMIEICQDIVHVLEALNTTLSYHSSFHYPQEGS